MYVWLFQILPSCGYCVKASVICIISINTFVNKETSYMNISYMS